MAAGIGAVADIVVPEIFTPYAQQITEEKARLVQSGVVTLDPALSASLAAGGLTFNVPSFQDVDNDADNVSTDASGSDSTPCKIGTGTEIQVRLSRNKSWADMDLAQALAGADPLASIAGRVGFYWARRLQAVFLATLAGIFADNDAAPGGSEHVIGDLTNDISGGAYIPGTTDFSAEAFIDTLSTMGDSENDLVAIQVHSVVFARMKKNNLIDFIPDATNPSAQGVPTFLGREVIVDDGMPVPSAGIYHSYLLGAGAIRWGRSSPRVPTAVDRKEESGDGGGQEILFNRVEWVMHPTGNAYVGTAASGGPSNATTVNNLAHAASWIRIFPERKQIKIARLITRES